MTREAEMLDEQNATEVENGTPSFFLNSRDRDFEYPLQEAARL
jgi:hypothetical protein